MQRTTIHSIILSASLAAALPLAACSKNDTPTSPTQSGPTVSTTPITPEPTPAPEPTPTPTPAPTPAPTVITGTVVNLARSGAGDLDISFRIDDFTIVRATANTPVTSGSQMGRTDFVRNGQQVTATGTRNGGFLDATRIDIIAQAP
jgi:hypothetical protein